MKHLEHFNHWYDRILNSFPFLLDDSSIKTIGIAWIFKEPVWWELPPAHYVNWWHVIPRITGNDAQFYNAQFFIRIGFPFAIFFHMRLSSTRLFQCGIGWKQTGRIAILFRFQTDASAAVGYHEGLPNTGQATGWNFGKH